jgi:anti-anti-sigma factor
VEHSTHDNVLVLSGALDVRSTAELRAVVYSLLGRTMGDVVVDIDHVESIDMTTLKLLAVANRSAEREGRRVVLRGGSPGVRRLLHLSHLRWMLPVEPGTPHPTAS